MRVVGGTARGRPLRAPAGRDVRPTSDLVRGAIANLVDSAVGWEGARVADLCCGTGALGIEALSRGASHVELVDAHPASLAAARANLTAVRLPEPPATVALTRSDVVAWAAREHPRFDVVVVDPPYAWDGWEALLAGLAALTGYVVAESDREVPPGPAWDVARVKTYGTTVVSVLTQCRDEVA